LDRLDGADAVSVNHLSGQQIRDRCQADVWMWHDIGVRHLRELRRPEVIEEDEWPDRSLCRGWKDAAGGHGGRNLCDATVQ
jgi:hypothetical protein